jgi:hypothetical protein
MPNEVWYSVADHVGARQLAGLTRLAMSVGETGPEI